MQLWFGPNALVTYEIGDSGLTIWSVVVMSVHHLPVFISWKVLDCQEAIYSFFSCIWFGGNGLVTDGGQTLSPQPPFFPQIQVWTVGKLFSEVSQEGQILPELLEQS